MALGRRLVKESQRHPLVEGPGKKGIELSLHQREEEAQVGTMADTIAVQVESGAHLVTMATGVKWRTVDGQLSSSPGLVQVLGVVRDFPDENTIVTGSLLRQEAQIELRQDGIGATDHLVEIGDLESNGDCCQCKAIGR